MKDLKKSILKYALQNAIKFNGKANPGAVLGRILGEYPSLKDKAQEIMKEIAKSLKEVNKLSVPEQTLKLEKIAPEMLKEEKPKEKKHELKELVNAKKSKVVMRF